MKKLRLVDLCAGLGGFHRGAHLVAPGLKGQVSFECILASELDDELRECYVHNFSSDNRFKTNYRKLYPPEDCAITPGLNDLYEANKLVRIHGDIRSLVDEQRGVLRRWPYGTKLAGKTIIPEHDLLCAGFPCQPFSKSGFQKGFGDREASRGTVWSLIWRIIAELQPTYLLLENVGNFERHDGGRTWKLIESQLKSNYWISATTHVGSGEGSYGLLSPHHFGYPHHRERFFVCAQHRIKAGKLDHYPFPANFRLVTPIQRRRRLQQTTAVTAARELRAILSKGTAGATSDELIGSRLTAGQIRCVNHWQELLNRISDLRADRRRRLGPVPSFPIWGFELDPWHHYPFETQPDAADDLSVQQQRRFRNSQINRATRLGLAGPNRGVNLIHYGRRSSAKSRAHNLPAYASRGSTPTWKVNFIRQNREWAWLLLEVLAESGGEKNLKWYRQWLDSLNEFPPSFQKLEWNCKGEDLKLWSQILQFRPSGLRAKRFRHIPALVALTTTQIPVVPVSRNCRQARLGAEGRFLFAREAAMLQGFPSTWSVPKARSKAFRALGNAVHARLASKILSVWLKEHGRRETSR